MKIFQCTKPSGVPRGPSHLQFPWLLRATMRSPLRSPAQGKGTQGFLPQPGKALERPSSTRLEARFPYLGSGARHCSRARGGESGLETG